VVIRIPFFAQGRSLVEGECWQVLGAFLLGRYVRAEGRSSQRVTMSHQSEAMNLSDPNFVVSIQCTGFIAVISKLGRDSV
jgi:hypothetical protein